MRPSARLAALLAGAALLVLVAAGCGRPPELDDAGSGGGPPVTGTGAPSGSPPAFPGPPAGSPGGPSLSPGPGLAVDCAGEPDQDEVLALLRDETLLSANADAQVVEGPLCADGWQYAVVNVPDLDPLQVLTQGEAGDLELVTAGTDVCTVEVRIQAPPGIRDAADCVG